MVALSAMSYFDRTIMSIAAPGIMKEFGISETAMGTVFSAFLLSYTILMTPAGGVVDRFGARRTLTVAGLAWVAFTGMTALGGWLPVAVLPTFLVIRFLFGACTAPLYPACAR